jgi:prepilin-type N-terminal cleavage/methylation domain-containing protein
MAKERKIKKGKAKSGFTIIEVVLVLAIAGLIFLMVFIALPALQSSQRNTQREDDLSRFLTAITDYQSNNSGQLPFTNGAAPGIVGTLGVAPIVTLNTAGATFATRYIDSGCGNIAIGAAVAGCGDQFTDPDGTVYSFRLIDTTNLSSGDTVDELGDFDHYVWVAPGFICGPTEGTVRVGTGDRQVALFMVLEGGAITCNDNQ